jgi:hypothetical protein
MQMLLSKKSWLPQVQVKDRMGPPNKSRSEGFGQRKKVKEPRTK